MNARDVTTKRAATEASLKRWQTRLTRAFNMVSKLEKQRRRLTLEELGKDTPVAVTVKVRKPLSETIDIAEVQRQVDAAIEGFTPQKIADVAAIVAQKAEEEETLPKWLDRSDPLIAEKMTAARKKAEAAERKKMPLNEKAARDYIKRKK